MPPPPSLLALLSSSGEAKNCAEVTEWRHPTRKLGRFAYLARGVMDILCSCFAFFVHKTCSSSLNASLEGNCGGKCDAG